MADISSATRQVFQALQGTNRSELDPDIRYDLLSEYAETLGQISRSLLPHFAAQPHPLPAANRRIVASLVKLLQEYATGFEIVAADILATTESDLLENALYRSLEVLRDCLVTCYRGYQTPPQGLWWQMHEIFRFLNESGMAEGESPAVAIPYVEALLFDLADPHRLSPAEMDIVWQCLHLFAPSAKLLSPEQDSGSAGKYLVVYAANCGPVEVDDFKLSSANEGRVLQTSRVARNFHQLMSDIEQGRQDKLPAELANSLGPSALPLLRREVATYAVRPKRQFNRTYQDDDLAIIRGVSALHSRVGANPGRNGEDEESIALAGDARAGVNLGSEATYNAEQWRQVNFSANGVAIAKDGESRYRVNVGDLLGVSGLGGKEGWVPVVIRRLRYQDEQLLVGVQLLAPDAEPAIAASADASAEKSASQVLLASGDAGGDRQFVIAQRGTYRQDAALSLETAARVDSVRTGALVEASEFFEMFEVQNTDTQA